MLSSYTVETMDAFDELPDNFDQAYTLFSQMYGDAKGIGDSQAAGSAGTAEALLNDRERQVFTRFLDNVLDDPKGAAESSEIKWLDQHFTGSAAPQAAYPPRPSQGGYHTENKLSHDFYRGFRDVNQNWNQILPGQHPQMSTPLPHAAAPTVAPAVGVIGAGGHIVPSVPKNYDAKSYELNTFSSAPRIASGGGPAAALQGLHVPSGTTPFSAVQAFSTACMAHVAAREYSPSQSPRNYVEQPPLEPEPKRSRTTSPPEPLPTPLQTPISKKKREYLSENQVRINHINSEKRRRDLISSNFKAMCSLVPSIQDAPPNLPKATILQNVYEYLLEVAEDNKQLRAELEAQGIDCGDIEQHKLGEKLIEGP